MSKKKEATKVEVTVRVPMPQHLSAFVVWMEDLPSKDTPLDSRSRNIIPARLRDFFYPDFIYKRELRCDRVNFPNADSYIEFKLHSEMAQLKRLQITPKSVTKFNYFVMSYLTAHVSKLLRSEAKLPNRTRSNRVVIQDFLDEIGVCGSYDWDNLRKAVNRYEKNRSNPV